MKKRELSMVPDKPELSDGKEDKELTFAQIPDPLVVSK